jgi:MSHA biogenesis protein MshI
LLGIRWKNKRRQGCVGVAFGREGFAVGHATTGGRDEPPRLHAADQFAAADADILASQLADWVDDHGVKGVGVHAVLAPGEYHVLQIDAPPVAATEMRQAAAWRVRELIDFPIDQAVIDTFDPPSGIQRGSQRVNVVVAHRAVIADRVDQLERTGLSVETIDIAELAQGQVSKRLPDEDGHALLALDEAEGLITVYRADEQYLARTLGTGRAPLASDDTGRAGESILLEVQRSLDYFESTLAQSGLTTLYLFPPEEGLTTFAATAQDNLASVDCHPFELGDVVRVEAEPHHSDATTLRAVGAALRGVEGSG